MTRGFERHVIPEQHKKKSFYKFSTPINIDGICQDYQSISDDAWSASYWGDIHCSVGTLLLRGGTTGTQEDYFSETIRDHPLLDSLPTIKKLVATDGPFGGASYVFIFRTEPNGVTRIHTDDHPKWKNMYRIHIPIKTNPGAMFVSVNKAIHFSQGHVWSFDNQIQHGVVNGPIERVHLIFDVPYNDVIAKEIETAEHLVGEENTSLVKKISDPAKAIKSYPGDVWVARNIKILKDKGMDSKEIASAFNAKNIPIKQHVTKGTRRVTKKWNFKMIENF